MASFPNFVFKEADKFSGQRIFFQRCRHRIRLPPFFFSKGTSIKLWGRIPAIFGGGGGGGGAQIKSGMTLKQSCICRMIIILRLYPVQQSKKVKFKIFTVHFDIMIYLFYNLLLKVKLKFPSKTVYKEIKEEANASIVRNVVCGTNSSIVNAMWSSEELKSCVLSNVEKEIQVVQQKVSLHSHIYLP